MLKKLSLLILGALLLVTACAELTNATDATNKPETTSILLWTDKGTCDDCYRYASYADAEKALKDNKNNLISRKRTFKKDNMDANMFNRIKNLPSGTKHVVNMTAGSLGDYRIISKP